MYHVVPRLNWDAARPTLYWIVGQPGCDRVTAARIFWSSDPKFEAQRLRNREEIPNWLGENQKLRRRILNRWRNGDFPDTGYGTGSDRAPEMISSAYSQFLGGEVDPLNLPTDLFATFDGPVPTPSAMHDPRENPELWDLLAALGTTCGPRPHETGNGARADEAQNFCEKSGETTGLKMTHTGKENMFLMAMVGLGVLFAVGLIVLLEL